VSKKTGPAVPGPSTTVFGFTLRRLSGSPPPPEEIVANLRRFRCLSGRPPSRRLAGAAAAAVLDDHFARPDAVPADLLDAFHDVDVPIHHNAHLTAAALRADPARVRETGRWLIRHGTHQCSVVVGLALLATGHDEEDVALLETIGGASDSCAPLAAYALRRRNGGTAAMIRLADRSHGWSRVYLVEALCESGGPAARHWLVRHACDGDYLNGYFAGEVATAGHLHALITAADADTELVDHTGRLLMAMIGTGVGAGPEQYPSGLAIIEAWVRHLERGEPAPQRCYQAADVAEFFLNRDPEQHERLLRRIRRLLSRRSWQAALRDADDIPRVRHVARVRERLASRTIRDCGRPVGGSAGRDSQSGVRGAR
jgi:hypothetical protein